MSYGCQCLELSNGRLLDAVGQPGAQAVCLSVAQELLHLAGSSEMALRVRRQPPNPFRHLLPLMTPEHSLLCSGVPPESVLPLKRMWLTTQQGDTVELDEQATRTAQRYPTFARVELLELLREHVAQVLRPKCADWAISMSAGSMSALDHAIAMFLNPGEAQRKTMEFA